MQPSHSPRRIACLQPSATVILANLGHLDRVQACTRYCADVVPELDVSSRAILPDSWNANAEEIIATHPDLVIAAVPYQEKAVSEILKSGARFLGLAPRTMDDIYIDIATIAGIVEATDRGQEIIASMQRRIEDVRSQTSGASRPRVFCEEWGKPLIASQPWVAELVTAAGGQFVGVPGRQCPPQEVSDLAPEIIIAAWCGAGDRVPLKKIMADRGWLQTPAALSGRVFCIRDEFLNTPAPTLIQGLNALAFAIHPELFPRTKGIREITAVPTSPVSNARP
jgi:iron complex transport system substrate-binding protein